MARQFEDLLDLPVYEGAARIAFEYLGRAAKALQAMKKGDDEAALHDFRVSLRRLRSNLQAYEPYLEAAISRKQRRKVRDMASSTGAGRDAEVHIAWLEGIEDRLAPREEPGYRWLLETLRARLDASYGQALDDVPKRFRKLDRRLREGLESFLNTAAAGGLTEGVRFGTALGSLLPAYADAVDTHLSRIHSAQDSTEGHRARIRGKRLRYILEPVREVVQGVDDLLAQLKDLQDLLGDLHDAQLLEGEVRDLLDGSLPSGPAAEDVRPGLDGVLRALREDQARLFSGLQERWLGGHSAGFFAGVEAVGRVLGTGWHPDVEIERKYLLSGLPPILDGRDFRHIDQGYLPGERLMERVRRVRQDGRERYVRSVKMGTGIRRLELQEETTPDVFHTLWPLTEGRRLTKRRFRVTHAGLMWEIDDFTDRDLVIAEVELPSVEVEPDVPPWLSDYVVREVTDEAEYLNVNLAR